MTNTIVRTVTASEETAAVQAVVLAFSGDPAARWTWPKPHEFLEHFPKFVRAFGGKAFAHSSAYCADGCAGAALWLPPGVRPDEEKLDALVRATVSPEIQNDVASMMEQMAGYHPHEPHWYLPLIGVDPAHQGKGLGGALMQHALAICDREKLPAYLESSNPRNIPLYERHGFVVMGTIQVGTSPPIRPMLRKARR